MRLIDADELHELLNWTLFKPPYSKAQVRQFIDTARTVDAVKAVRCKDCIHYGFTDNRVPKEQVWWCYKWSNVMRENDFCSYGEVNNETD